MIEVQGLIKEHGNLRVLDGISLTVKRGETAAVIGPSGGGKSTLLRCLNGLEEFQEGGIVIDDDLRLMAGMAARERSSLLQQLRRRVNMVFQQFHLFPHMTVLENVMAGPLYVLQEDRAQAQDEAERLLARVGLSDKLQARPEQLSGGQQQRVAIARSLAMKPEAILFDEPTSALDPKMSREVLSVMSDLGRSGQTMVVVTHSMGFARRVARTVHVMSRGRIIESGPPDQIFGQAREAATRSFLQELIGD
jgi:ABC-type polar amino acid transport system ATPase subunit